MANKKGKTKRRVGDWIIENDVPRPGLRKDKDMWYPFPEMHVDESFVLPIEKADNCRNAANMFCRRNEAAWKFSVCKINEKESRCWRVQ